MTRTITETAVVSGTHRYKYFKRPIMPKVNAYPPQILLAPTTAGKEENNPLIPVHEEVEKTVKDAGIQTLYRESEAQTVPYTPEYVLPPGVTEPEVLLLKNLTYEDGLPLGSKEMDMIEYARAKHEMECNLPPFTDEASLLLRKRLMEQAEMREFKLREAEIDNARNEKLDNLSQMLQDREESHEFMTSQRLESIRLIRLEEREKVLAKLKLKRIKILRRIAQQRNASEPLLSQTKGRDIINEYFDRSSAIYAPIKRDGKYVPKDPNVFDIASRTLPLNTMNNVMTVEYAIPKQYTLNEGHPGPTPAAIMSKSLPSALGINPGTGGGGGTVAGAGHRVGIRVKAAEPRLTSAAQRHLRQTKRDIEEMHQILLHKKMTAQGYYASGVSGSAPNTANANMKATGGRNNTTSPPQSPQKLHNTTNTNTNNNNNNTSSLLSKKPKGRPPTPDFTRDRDQVLFRPPTALPTTTTADATATNDETGATNYDLLDEENNGEMANPVVAIEPLSQYAYDYPFQLAIQLLQRLIRGRAVQNIMFEGKYRRRELIAELRAVDEAMIAQQEEEHATDYPIQQATEEKTIREDVLGNTSYDSIVGSVSSNVLHIMAQEQERIELFRQCQTQAEQALIERRNLEAVEAGRRQREGMDYPIHIHTNTHTNDNSEGGVGGIGSDSSHHYQHH